MKYIVSIVKHGYVEIDSGDAWNACRIASEMKPEDFDWEDGFRVLDATCNEDQDTDKN